MSEYKVCFNCGDLKMHQIASDAKGNCTEVYCFTCGCLERHNEHGIE